MIVRSAHGARMRNGDAVRQPWGFDDVGLRIGTLPPRRLARRSAAPASVAVDQGLRAYMLRVYNYMVLGLAITGFAALGIYMLSVTGDAVGRRQGDAQRRRGSGCASAAACS